MKYWTTKDGTKLLIKDMETSHIENCIYMLIKVIKTKPDEYVYIGDNYYAEQAVEAENRYNNEKEEEILKAIKTFTRELNKRKKTSLSKVITKEEVDKFNNE